MPIRNMRIILLPSNVTESENQVCLNVSYGYFVIKNNFNKNCQEDNNLIPHNIYICDPNADIDDGMYVIDTSKTPFVCKQYIIYFKHNIHLPAPSHLLKVEASTDPELKILVPSINLKWIRDNIVMKASENIANAYVEVAEFSGINHSYYPITDIETNEIVMKTVIQFNIYKKIIHNTSIHTPLIITREFPAPYDFYKIGEPAGWYRGKCTTNDNYAMIGTGIGKVKYPVHGVKREGMEDAYIVDEATIPKDLDLVAEIIKPEYEKTNNRSSIKDFWPMTLHKFNLEMSKPEISQPFTLGYKVEFNDGYITWCPKDIFERIHNTSTNGTN